MKTKLFTSFITFLIPLLTLAQVPGMYKYTQLDGYTSAVSYRICQDERGYLWIGTDNGGIRFDGKQFIYLQNLHHSANGEILECVPFTHQLIAMVPLSGRFFFLNNDTVVHFDKTKAQKIEEAQWLNQYRHDISTGSGWHWDIHGNNDTAWVAHKFTGTQLQKIPLPVRFLPFQVMTDRIIGNRDGQMFSYDYHSKQIIPLTHSDHTNFSIEKDKLIVLHRGKEFFMTYDLTTQAINIFKWEPNGQNLKKINAIKTAIPDPAFSSYSTSKKQYLFSGVANRTKEIQYFPDVSDSLNPSLKLNIPGVKANNCFIDNHNNIWITSANNAIYFLSENHIKNALATQNIPLKEDIPKYISGTEKQLFISYLASKTLSVLTEKGAQHLLLNDHFSEACRGMLFINDSNILAYNRDFALVNTVNGSIKYLNLYADGPFKDACLYEGGLLCASAAGLFYYPQALKSNDRRAVLFKYRCVATNVVGRTILIGTPNGLYTKEGLEGKVVKRMDKPISDADIMDITLLDSSNALIATNGKGLLIYDGSGAIHPAQYEGKISDTLPQYIGLLFRQNEHTYWAATNSGAYCIEFTQDRKVRSVKNYNFYDGLPSDIVTSIFVKDDTAYIATAAGLGIISLKHNNNTEIAVPSVYINSIDAENIHLTEPERAVGFPYDKNNLRILISAISYESLGNVSYYYRLQPYQANWVQTSNPEIRFSHLPPGKYTLEVFATNAKGGKSDVVQLTINIKPAFWQTSWFKALIIALVISIIILVFRQLIKRLEKKRYKDIQQKKHLAELELEAIKAQINPHFIYNCLNSIQYLNYREDYEQAQQYLSIFSRLIRKTMHYAQKVFISVDEEVEYLSNYLQMEQLRFKDKLHYSITVDPDIKKETALPAMLLQPYVENALKHGISGMQSGGMIHVDFKKNSTGLQVEVRDNGPGFSNLKTQDSLGLRLSGTRALSYNELFNINVNVSYYNEQDVVPNRAKTGAVVKVTITQTKSGTDDNYYLNN